MATPYGGIYKGQVFNPSANAYYGLENGQYVPLAPYQYLYGGTADQPTQEMQYQYLDPNSDFAQSVFGRNPSSDDFADKAFQLGVQGGAIGGTIAGGAGLFGAPAAAGLGPATGAIEAAPVIGGAGEPLLTGIASGADPFVDTGVLGAAGLGAGAGTAALDAGAGATAAGAAAGSGLGTTLAQGGLLAAIARGLPGVAGAVASKQQSDAYERLANQYLSIGAPSRARFEGSFAPGFTMASDPGFTDALDQTTKATLHGLSVSGNPADSPNAWMQTLSDINSKFAFPALQEYRRLNAGTGGLASLTAAAPGAATAGVNAEGNVLNSLGGAAADIFNPPKSLADLLREARQAGY